MMFAVAPRASWCLALTAAALLGFSRGDDASAFVQVTLTEKSSEGLSLRARVAAVTRLEQEGRLVAASADGAWVRDSAAASPAKKGQKVVAPPSSEKNKGKYGFYLHTFDKPEACIQLLRQVRQFYPEEPVYIMSDGGQNFSGLCNSIGNCNFQWRPPANDRWNPMPFFNRIREAARWLDTTYLIMLEPDNEIRGTIAQDPTDDAGGLRDSNPPFGKPLLEYLQKMGRAHTGNNNFTIDWNRFGLAGGSYFRTASILEAFDPMDQDWKELRKFCGKKIWSSDVAMPMALAAHGYTYKPWNEVTQTRSESYWGKPENHPAFRHYGRDETKPHYAGASMLMSSADQGLVTHIPVNAGNVACQGCVWVADDVCWKQYPVQCPTRAHDAGPAW